MKKLNIFFCLFFLTITNNYLMHQDKLENELKRYFNEMTSSINESMTRITDESTFPETTTVSPAKIEIDSKDSELFVIYLQLNQEITPENINTEKGNGYIKIEINFAQSYYQIILKEQEISVISQSNLTIKNTNNTKYTQSSSQMSRREKLNKKIDLSSLKIKVNTKDQTMQLVTKYNDVKKNSDIDIEFK